MELVKYKISAFVGMIIMGVGSFMACLSENNTVVNIGNGLLVASIIVMSYGFSKWQP